MNLTIICASHRPQSQSFKVANFLKEELEQKNEKGLNVDLLDLTKLNLPVWSEEVPMGKFKEKKQWERISKSLQESHAFIFVCPEYGGMVPAILKNFFLFCSQNELRHKPALIVGVSSGINGAYPISELRMSSYKNTFLCYLPEHLIIRNVEEILNKDSKFGEENDQESNLKKRIHYSLDLVLLYSKAFSMIHSSDIIKNSIYRFGM